MITKIPVEQMPEEMLVNKKSAKFRMKNYRVVFSKSFHFFAWGIVLFIIFCAIAPSIIAPYSPLTMNTEAILQAPSTQHIMGTDQFGRDIFSLVVHGSRGSLLIGVIAVLIGGLIGVVIGLLAGYGNLILDNLFMRAIEMLMSIPGILLAIILSSFLEPSLLTLSIAVAVASVPSYARIVRGQVISIKNAKFIDAAKSIGSSHFSIIFKHILPNCFAIIIVMVTIGLGNAILLATALSFLGLGIITEIPDWGYLLSQGRDYLSMAWWVSVFPGIAVTFLVISANIIGEDLRERLNPRSNK